MSPVLLVLVLLVLMVLPAYLGAAAAALGLSYLNALLMLVALAAVCATPRPGHLRPRCQPGGALECSGVKRNGDQQILAFGYAALLVFAVRQSFLGCIALTGNWSEVYWCC